MKPLLAACVFAAFAFPSLAQTTILVGPSGLPEIRDAIAVANPGDTILVEPGSYTWFALTKPLTIRAITPGTVFVPRFLLGAFVQLPAGGTVHFVGLHIDILSAFLGVSGHLILDQCTIVGVPPLSVSGGTVHVQASELRVVPTSAFWPYFALRATGSHVTAIDSRFLGSPTSGNAVDLQSGSTFHGSHVELQAMSGVALSATAGCAAWLVDSTLTSGPTTCPLVATSGHMERTTLVPNCGALPAGAVLGVSRPAPLLVGTPFVLDFQAQPLETVAVFASSGLVRTLVPGIEQAVLLDPTNTWLAFVLAADAQGAAQMTWNVPASPSLVDTDVWFQGLGFASTPMQMSPVAGGRIR